MDALDEQLAQLKLMTSRALTPSNYTTHSDPCSCSTNHAVAPGCGDNGVACPVSHQLQTSGSLSKKIGPAVPPKPLKKVGYHHTGSDGEGSSPIEHHRKLQNTYSNMKMTLDNSIILDQQLEALEYHKKQLEKRNRTGSDSLDNTDVIIDSNLVEKEAKGNPTKNYHVYSNIDDFASKLNAETDSDVLVYSNLRYQPQAASNQKESLPARRTDTNQIVYSNVGFGSNPPPPHFELPQATIPIGISLDNVNFEYSQQSNEDDLPPPPSPVSSSYSELRRATDSFPQMSQYPSYSSVENVSNIQKAQQLPLHYHVAQTADQMLGQSRTPINSIVPRQAHFHNDPQQIYVNTQCQNVYNTFEPMQAASATNSEYYGYGDLSQSLSAYESIYEPINPRPPSQLSSRSNYSLYTSYVNGSQGTTGDSMKSSNMTSASSNTSIVNSQSGSCDDKLTGRKEAEVEALTNLLVSSMDSGGDSDTYGICVKCCERVIGESSGCTAMDRIYHINCFTCSQCNVNLQGKPFYAFDGEPYCEEDYLNTLEKCSVCMKPILERILRATGKPYHPGCFCCVVCGNSLDGIPFTVDATNQNYCIEDFHKKFAPRCCVCQEPIMPEPGQDETVRVVALDRSFHFKCYKCEDCGLLLSSEAEGRGCYPLDDHVLCKSCNAQRVQALTNRMTTEL